MRINIFSMVVLDVNLAKIRTKANEGPSVSPLLCLSFPRSPKKSHCKVVRKSKETKKQKLLGDGVTN